MKCIICDEDLIACEKGTFSSLLGYTSPPGHDHDNTCLNKVYWCRNGHEQIISKRKKCPNPDCDWVGKEDCFCHHGKKVDEWPEVNEVRLTRWQKKLELKDN
jgi:hypothetical protein